MKDMKFDKMVDGNKKVLLTIDFKLDEKRFMGKFIKMIRKRLEEIKGEEKNGI